MSHKCLTAAVAAIVLCASSLAAQDASGKISLELNRATASTDGGCQVVFFGQNGLDQALEEVTWRLAVFDAEGVFRNLLALPLGSLSAGKRRVVQYNLPAPCAELSEIIVNDVAECKIAGNPDATNQMCLTELTVTSRADIAFGL